MIHRLNNSLKNLHLMFQNSGYRFRTATVMLAVLLSATFVSSCKGAGQAQNSTGGFVQIFDGKTLNGWEGDTTYWRVENGNLVGEITPSTLLKTNSFIIWRGGQPGDFELTL